MSNKNEILMMMVKSPDGTWPPNKGENKVTFQQKN